MFKLSSITLTAAMALGVSAQAQTESQVRADSSHHVVEYRMNVVSRTTQAVSYKHRSGATKIDFQGTDLMPGAAGIGEASKPQVNARPSTLSAI